jgi:hypothetical protein
MRSFASRAAAALIAGAAAVVVAAGPTAAATPDGLYVVWQAKTTITVPSEQPAMWGADCMGANSMDCVSVGEEFGAPVNGQPTYQPLAMTTTGSGWTVETPSDPGPQSALQGVSCTSFDFCLGVGKVGNLGAAMAESWNGSSWAMTSTPPSGRGFFADSCDILLGRNVCTAVGWTSSGTTIEPLAEYYTGQKWQLETVPMPTGATSAQLSGVSCPVATLCTAVGYYVNSSGVEVPLVEKSSSMTWSIVSTPATAGSLAGVSCPSTTICMAVGDANGALSEYWNGSTWAVETVPKYDGMSNALDAVYCVSTAVCTAVGPAAAENWVTSSWSALPLPEPSGVFFQPNGVGCWSPDYCVATGTGYYGSNQSEIEVDVSLPVT